MSCPSPAPKRCSPQAAAWASLASGHRLAEAVAERRGEREAGRNGQDGGVERVPAPVPDLAGDGGGNGAVAPAPSPATSAAIASHQPSAEASRGVATSRFLDRSRSPTTSAASILVPPMSMARIASSLMPPRLRTASATARREPLGDVLGPGDRRADDDGKGPGLDRRPRLLRRPDAALGDDRLAAARRSRATSARSGSSGTGPAGVAGERGAEQVGAEPRGGLASAAVGDVGHRQAADGDGSRRGGRRAGTGRGQSVASKAMMSAPASARASTSASVAVMRTGVPGKSRLTRPMIGRSRGGAHGGDVGDALDADRGGAAGEGGEGEADDDLGPVERAARHRLAGHDQGSAKSLDDVQCPRPRLADDIGDQTS